MAVDGRWLSLQDFWTNMGFCFRASSIGLSLLVIVGTGPHSLAGWLDTQIYLPTFLALPPADSITLEWWHCGLLSFSSIVILYRYVLHDFLTPDSVPYGILSLPSSFRTFHSGDSIPRYNPLLVKGINMNWWVREEKRKRKNWMNKSHSVSTH